jgi:putative PIG3 family NAD(P)H quinone oxidoreductase
MRIVDAPQAGGPEALLVRAHDLPSPPPDHVLIRVAAAGLNRADLLQRRGVYPSPPGAPAYPGLEVSGTVVALGAGVNAFALGDPVCALLQGGGYAEYCVAPVGQTLPIPPGVDLVDAAALPEALFTVWSNVYDYGGLAPGERLLVHGGASGIGVAAIQLAHALGNPVCATAGTEEKCRACAALGAAPAINYRSEDFVAAVRAATQGRGVDVVLDMVGGDYLQRDLEVLAAGGRVVVIATQHGTQAQVDLRLVMAKRLVVTGSMLRPQPVAFKAALKAKLLARVWPLYARGAIKPVIDRRFPLQEAAAAHAYMESGRHIGKILLEVGGGLHDTGVQSPSLAPGRPI